MLKIKRYMREYASDIVKRKKEMGYFGANLTELQDCIHCPLGPLDKYAKGLITEYETIMELADIDDYYC